MTDQSMDQQKYINELLDFIEKSPTAFHVVANVKKRLDQCGFQEYSERQLWSIEPGSKGYVIRNHSSLIAFVVPKKVENGGNAIPTGFQIVAAHSDSPCFKIKEKAEHDVENHYIMLNVEKYGGMILNSWLDRPLSAAGRIVTTKNGKLEEKLINLDQDLFLIPSLAIHMTRGNADAPLHVQTDLQPLVDMEEGEGIFMDQIASEAGVREEDILGMDMFLYNRQKGTTLGLNQQLLAAPRLDDQECVFAGLQGLLEADHKDCKTGKINLLAVFDNEEVGSLTRQGADSNFLSCTLSNLCEGMHLSEGDYRRMLAGSFLVSADNAHAVHPNHREKADPTNRPYLNQGIVIKYHGGQKYTTDAVTGAVIKKLCRENKLSYQTYHNHSDIAGGSTLGNIALGKVSIPAADIGLPQLAMHSAYETAGVADLLDMIQLLKAFYSCE